MAAGSQKSDSPSSKDGGPASGKAANPRQAAAQARAEAEAAERRRERLVRIIGGIAVLVVVAGLLTVGFLAGNKGDSDTPSAAAAPTPDASAPAPKDVKSDTFGWSYGTGWTSENEAKLPTLELWEDFQCPGCKALENAAGSEIAALGASGTVKLLYRPSIFLDGRANLKIPNSSARATAAWGCAIDAGKGIEYHSTVFANQPAEGDGYTDEALIGFASQAGIAGAELETFTTCFQDGKYLPWAANSQQIFETNDVGGTPAGYLNGVELAPADLADIEGLKQKIAAATAK